MTENHHDFTANSTSHNVGAQRLVRPFAGEIRYHDKHGEVEVLRTWGPRSCKVRVAATGSREILFDENLHRPNSRVSMT